ncbi:GFA family protein [Rhizobium mesosinicum]|uniref:GFA family protein n=1 Tax=Rhizobium mesosinicum TaxID=335017 RepID=A0ABS7GXP7_9HYPH|nr:GFA family protein [Rhizobium mesosinicum]MBW9054758.1 GFA family protein [Rhizobium mesosinicum]
MADARCSCGALRLALPEKPNVVIVCHCIECQRRTGAPFGAGAFYPAEAVTMSGTAKLYTRDAASGGKVHSYFCPNCGSSVYWKADNLPSMIGVALGALGDVSQFPAPAKSIFERSKHNWVQIDRADEHFHQGSVARQSH